MIRAVAATVLSVLAGVGAYGQSDGPRAEFEVASIKPSPPPDVSAAECCIVDLLIQ